MIYFSIIVFSLLVFGTAELCGISVPAILGLLNFRKRNTLTEEVGRIKGKPTGFFQKRNWELEQILQSTGRSSKYVTIKRLSIVGFVLGGLLAFFLDNVFLIPVMAIGFTLIPTWYIKMTTGSFQRKQNAEMETVLSIITTSYLQNEDIVRAIRENLPYINPPFRGGFEAFVNETEYINANTESALVTLKLRYSNEIYQEWVDVLIQCQNDRSMKVILPTVVQKFSDLRIVQSELDTILVSPRYEFFTMLALVIANIPLIRIINIEWYNTLIYTTPGKAALAICAVIALFAFSRIVHLSRPLEYKG